MTDQFLNGWISIAEATRLTGYSRAYLRRLAAEGRVRACKVGRDWLVGKASVTKYKEQMDALGSQRHDPWREDLAARGRGRKSRQKREEVGQ